MRAPLLWMAAGFCAGVALAGFLAVSMLMIAGCAIILLGLALFTFRKQFHGVHLLCLSLLFIAEGSLWKVTADADLPPQHLSRQLQNGQIDLNGPCRIEGKVSHDPIKTPFGYFIRIEVEAIQSAGERTRTAGGIRLALPTEVMARGNGTAPVEYGDQIEALVSLRIPKRFRNPGSFDFGEQLRREGIYLVGNVKSVRLLRRVTAAPAWSPIGMIYRVRHRLQVEIERAYRKDGKLTSQGGAMEAILLGNRYFLDRDLEQDFQATGIYHVLVIAGLHVGIIAWFLLTLFRWIRLPRVAATLATLLFLFGYACMVEARTPIVRAVIMTSIYLSASLLERDRSPLNAIGVAVLLICAWQPQQLFDPGFQLSFSCVLSIAAIALPLSDRWVTPRLLALEDLENIGRDVHLTRFQASQRVHLRFRIEEWGQRPVVRLIPPGSMRFILVWRRKLAYRFVTLLIFSVAIQISFTLLMAVYFNRASLSAPILNLVAVPLMGWIVPLGLMELLAATIHLRLADLLAGIVSVALEGLMRISHWGSATTILNYRVVTPPRVFQVMTVLVIVTLGYAIVRRQKRIALASAAMAGILALLIFSSAFPPRPVPLGLTATVLDVGQGDAILVSFPDGKLMLVDGGGVAAAGFHEVVQEPRFDIGEDVLMPFLWGQRIQHLDRVVLTHAHNDHLSGLISVMKYCSVDELWVGTVPDSGLVRGLLAEAQRRNVRIRRVKRGEIQEMGGVKIEILSAGRERSVPAEADHDDSVVMRMEYGNTDFWLMGDFSGAMEARLQFKGESVHRTTLLKVGHHGSRTSTSELFLTRTRPRYAIISVASPSPFGHPSPVVLDRLARHHVAVFQTGPQGAILAQSDGKKWMVGPAL